MEGIQIDTILGTLARKRKIFHSEGDFQFSLGCEIQSLTNMKVIIERPMNSNNNATEHIDMYVYNEQIKIGIELKFIKDKFSGIVDSNYYCLKPSSAYDMRCYDILKDIQRLENYVENENKDEQIDIGYAIVLTNAKNLWTPKTNEKEYNYDEFRVFDGREIHGEMKWKPATGDGTKKGRTNSIRLKDNNTYLIQWKYYSEPKAEAEAGNSNKNLFKYMFVEVR